MRDFTLSLPNGTQLLSDADIMLEPGHSVVISGRSGSGKSTLFRAMAGIWPYGHGRVQRPLERCMFLPQRAYIPLGTLRHVVCYPDPPSMHNREEVARAMQDVGLGALVPRLDRDEPWAQVLSGGEQQRVAVARASAGEAGLAVPGRSDRKSRSPSRRRSCIACCGSGWRIPR